MWVFFQHLPSSPGMLGLGGCMWFNVAFAGHCADLTMLYGRQCVASRRCFVRLTMLEEASADLRDRSFPTKCSHVTPRHKSRSPIPKIHNMDAEHFTTETRAFPKKKCGACDFAVFGTQVTY